MSALSFTCIAKDFNPSQSANSELFSYREIKYQSDDMPGLTLGKPMATLAEVQAGIAKRPRKPQDDFYWDHPDDEERAAIPRAVCILRYVNMRNQSTTFRQRLEFAAGGPRSLPIRMAAINSNGLFAWIETDRDIDSVLVAKEGKLYLAKPLGGANSLDWGYEGCHAKLLRWYGDRLIVVSYEYSNQITTIEPLSGEESSFFLTQQADRWLIVDDLLCWLSDERGLVQTAALPSLRPGAPLPFTQFLRPNRQIKLAMLPEGNLAINNASPFFIIESLTLPSSDQRAALLEADIATDQLLHAIEANLSPATPAAWSARLIMEVFAYPFLHEALTDPTWRPSPVWLPVYWHKHLLSNGRVREAHEFLRLLDQLAAKLHPELPSRGWRPEWDTMTALVSLASIHVLRTCRLVADVCRSGELPPGTNCLLFDPFPRSKLRGSRMEPLRFPPVMRQAFEELRQSDAVAIRLPAAKT